MESEGKLGQETQGTLAVPAELLNVTTGELLPATTENAALVLREARAMKSRLNEVVAAATLFLAEESRIRGTKTFHLPGVSVVLDGGAKVEYDPEVLAAGLRDAGCPEERVGEVIVETVSRRVDRRILRQLVAANPDYKAAAAKAELRTEEPLRASVKAR